MNLADKIEQLKIKQDDNNKNLSQLEEALRVYHRLVEDGRLIPRGNTVQNIYTTYSFKSNADL